MYYVGIYWTRVRSTLRMPGAWCWKVTLRERTSLPVLTAHAPVPSNVMQTPFWNQTTSSVKPTESNWRGQPDRKATAGKGHCGSKTAPGWPAAAPDPWPPWPRVLGLVVRSRCPGCFVQEASSCPIWYDTDISLTCVVFLKTNGAEYQRIWDQNLILLHRGLICCLFFLTFSWR